MYEVRGTKVASPQVSAESRRANGWQIESVPGDFPQRVNLMRPFEHALARKMLSMLLQSYKRHPIALATDAEIHPIARP